MRHSYFPHDSRRHQNIPQAVTMLENLVARLEEKRADLASSCPQVDGGLARRGAGVRCTHQSAGETARTGQGRQEAMRRRATCPVLAPFDATRPAAIGFDPMTTGQQYA